MVAAAEASEGRAMMRPRETIRGRNNALEWALQLLLVTPPRKRVTRKSSASQARHPAS
jgi:hypothetical protein